ncbi:hypothetical protein AL518_20375 [Hafnia paralvei]|nr:hypothetical protein AL518_20375 [Hafnia paralvei]PNK65710.1 hypothetical protein A6J69_001050 [Hafnia paralvei]RDA70298.1 hypothetical protein DVH08_07850 [Hafnia paralvei]RDA72766.1 hypothetical protein DU449_01110 [Hafnia paralvei]RDA73321.1 hypothetical protein DVH09_00805 [Hafnia paralvei]
MATETPASLATSFMVAMGLSKNTVKGKRLHASVAEKPRCCKPRNVSVFSDMSQNRRNHTASYILRTNVAISRWRQMEQRFNLNIPEVLIGEISVHLLLKPINYTDLRGCVGFFLFPLRH